MEFNGDAGAGAGAGDTGAGSGGAGGSAADVLLGSAATAGGDAAGAAASGDAGSRAGDGAPAAGADGAADPDWFSQLSTETAEGDTASLLDWVKASGAKDLNGLAKIARDNQRALRESGRVKVPGENATPEERAAFNKAIGVPETVEGYALAEVRDADGNAVPLNKPLLDRLAGKALEAGVPKAAYEALVNDFVSAQIEDMASSNATNQAEAAAWANAHGAQRSEKLNAVNRGAEALGLSAQEVLSIREAIGSRRTLDALSRLGEGVGEDVLLAGGGSRQFLLSGDQAQAQINQMRADPKIAAAISVKGSPENLKYERLVTVAGEAANRRAAAGL